ncbi:MAG: Uma2 family endonuclease [Rubrobacteraceae bacterium]
MVTAQKPVTAEDLFSMPDYGLRSELVQGEVRWMTPAGNVHGRLAVNVTLSLGPHVRENDLGTVFAAETGFKIATEPDTVRAPDVAFVRRERVEAVGDIEGYWPGPPDLAVEVISPNDLYTEVEEKVADWLEAGTNMVVVVNPRNKTVAVRRSASEITVLRESETLDGADVVAGWSLPIRDVFR